MSRRASERVPSPALIAVRQNDSLMPTTAVWTSRLTTAGEAARLPTVVGCSVTLPNRMKLYSALTDQFCRKAHSTPAPATQPVRSKLPVAVPANGPVQLRVQFVAGEGRAALAIDQHAVEGIAEPARDRCEIIVLQRDGEACAAAERSAVADLDVGPRIGASTPSTTWPIW